MNDLRHKKVLVVGAGRSGMSAARLLAARGAEVLLTDEAAVSRFSQLPSEIGLRLGEPGFPVEGRDLIVVSPGIPLAHPDLRRAAALRIPIVAEVELASWFLDRPLVGITGTNGKSTTTALCGQMLRAAGKRTFVGGNLGTPLSEAVGGQDEVLVVELSSFQLEAIDRFHASVAAILNLTPDHLDRYADFAAYARAKLRLLETQVAGDVAILNRDDAELRHAKGLATIETFGLGGQGQAQPVAGGFALAGPKGSESYRLENRALRGDHNLLNAMAAALCARAAGAGSQAIQAGLDRFPGLPHRLELVRELGGVEYLNDSKATNVDSAAVALKAIPGPLIWIAGGRGKGAPYAPLRPLLQGRLRAALLIGEEAAALKSQLEGAGPCELMEDLTRAVRRAAKLARAGDAVLLSPACSSYDQFRNYEERGELFKALVASL